MNESCSVTVDVLLSQVATRSGSPLNPFSSMYTIVRELHNVDRKSLAMVLYRREKEGVFPVFPHPTGNARTPSLSLDTTQIT